MVNQTLTIVLGPNLSDTRTVLSTSTSTPSFHSPRCTYCRVDIVPFSRSIVLSASQRTTLRCPPRNTNMPVSVALARSSSAPNYPEPRLMLLAKALPLPTWKTARQVDAGVQTSGSEAWTVLWTVVTKPAASPVVECFPINPTNDYRNYASPE